MKRLIDTIASPELLDLIVCLALSFGGAGLIVALTGTP